MNLPFPSSLRPPARVEPSPPSADLIDVIDAQGRVAWANGERCAALGYPEGALSGMPVASCYAPAAVEWLRARHARLTDEPAEIALTRRDGSELRVLARAVGTPDDGGRLTIVKTALGALAARHERPFVHVNCGSIPESLFESELFGHERGAFTGALGTGKRGYIEAAAGGTLFLDEIGELPPGCQAKLLHFLEDGSVQAIGATQARRVDTAVIAATNRDLRGLVAARSFRADLFFRIATFTIELPSLRGPEAVGPMLDLLLARLNAGRDVPLALSDAARRRLLAHEYTGNVRELRNALECASILADNCIDVAHLPAWMQRTPSAEDGRHAPVNLRERVRQLERQAIAEAIARHGSKREAARRLGIDVATLIRKARAD